MPREEKVRCTENLGIQEGTSGQVCLGGLPWIRRQIGLCVADLKGGSRRLFDG